MKIAAETKMEPVLIPVATMTPEALLAHVGKVVGQKTLMYRLRGSRTLYQKWVDGVTPCFLRRCHDFLVLLRELHFEDLAYSVCAFLASAVGGVVITAEQMRVLKDIAEQQGIKIVSDEWRA